MTERRRPHRRGGRGPRSYDRTTAESNGEPNPYRDGAAETPVDGGDPIDNAPPPIVSIATEDAPAAPPPPPQPSASPAAAPPSAESSSETREQEQRPPREDRGPDQRPPREHRDHRHHHRDQRSDRNENGAAGRQNNQQFNGSRRRRSSPTARRRVGSTRRVTAASFGVPGTVTSQSRAMRTSHRNSSGNTACDVATPSSQARDAITADAVRSSICSRSMTRIRRLRLADRISARSPRPTRI